jgi:hypothetical protein
MGLLLSRGREPAAMSDTLVGIFTFVGVGVVVGFIVGVIANILWEPSPWLTGAIVGPFAAVAGAITASALRSRGRVEIP